MPASAGGGGAAAAAAGGVPVLWLAVGRGQQVDGRHAERVQGAAGRPHRRARNVGGEWHCASIGRGDGRRRIQLAAAADECMRRAAHACCLFEAPLAAEVSQHASHSLIPRQERPRHTRTWRIATWESGRVLTAGSRATSRPAHTVTPRHWPRRLPSPAQPLGSGSPGLSSSDGVCMCRAGPAAGGAAGWAAAAACRASSSGDVLLEAQPQPRLHGEVRRGRGSRALPLLRQVPPACAADTPRPCSAAPATTHAGPRAAWRPGSSSGASGSGKCAAATRRRRWAAAGWTSLRARMCRRQWRSSLASRSETRTAGWG